MAALSATAEEVAMLASADLATPASWGDAVPPEEKPAVQWAKVGRKRLSVERPDPSKVSKTGSQVTVANRFAVLADSTDSSLIEDDPELDLAGSSLSSLSMDGYMEGFVAAMDMPPGPKGVGGD